MLRPGVIEMKPETVVRKVKEDETIDPLMKRIWLDHFENAPCIPGTCTSIISTITNFAVQN